MATKINPDKDHLTKVLVNLFLVHWEHDEKHKDAVHSNCKSRFVKCIDNLVVEGADATVAFEKAVQLLKYKHS